MKIEEIARYIKYPIQIIKHTDKSYLVMVYNVPEEDIVNVETIIFDLQNRFLDNTILLPMVKSIEITKQYYPEKIGS